MVWVFFMCERTCKTCNGVSNARRGALWSLQQMPGKGNRLVAEVRSRGETRRAPAMAVKYLASRLIETRYEAPHTPKYVIPKLVMYFADPENVLEMVRFFLPNPLHPYDLPRMGVINAGTVESYEVYTAGLVASFVKKRLVNVAEYLISFPWSPLSLSDMLNQVLPRLIDEPLTENMLQTRFQFVRTRMVMRLDFSRETYHFGPIWQALGGLDESRVADAFYGLFLSQSSLVRGLSRWALLHADTVIKEAFHDRGYLGSPQFAAEWRVVTRSAARCGKSRTLMSTRNIDLEFTTEEEKGLYRVERHEGYAQVPQLRALMRSIGYDRT